MTDRRRETGNRRRAPDDNDPISSLLVGLGGLALAGGAVYAASRFFSSDDQQESSQRSSGTTGRTPSSSYESPRFGGQRGSEPTGTTLTIAVDATPTRAGGLLVVPAHEAVYFYSIDWTEYFTFGNEPDKFEMVNALLGLSIYDDHVAHFHERRDKVVLKSDNTFCQNPDTVYSRQKNAAWKQFFSGVDSKLTEEPFHGKWQFATKSNDDHVRLADKLSRADHSKSSTLPVAELGPVGNKIMKYAMYNVSFGHWSLLRGIARQVPQDCRLVPASAEGGGECKTT